MVDIAHPMDSLTTTAPRPDYHGGGIVNLMSSLIGAHGGQPLHAELDLLPAAVLNDNRTTVLLVIDGLGYQWLQRSAPDGLLAGACLGAISSVFPSTTAAAITTFLSGEPPLRHGLTGWYTYLGELGCVMTVLPGTPRYGGVSYTRAGIDLRRLLGVEPVAARIASRTFMVAPAFIAHSDFNTAMAGTAEIHAFRDLTELFRKILGLIRSGGRERRYIYAYWPQLDTIGHTSGIDSSAARAHLDKIEARLAAFLKQAAGSGATALITADHGQIDADPAERIALEDHPEIAERLLLPLCGEPRAAYCYLRAGAADGFAHACAAAWGERMRLVSGQQLIADGLFGNGPAHPRIRDRVGDYCLLPTGRGVIHQRLAGEKPFAQIGVHGGLSVDELLVPLCRFDP